MREGVYIHPSSDVSEGVEIGSGTKVWQMCQLRTGARLGRNCVLGKGVFIDTNVQIGSNVKIQNGVSVYEGVTLEDGVFCGPHCVFTNDYRPRAVNPDGTLKRAEDWTITETHVKLGASIGANATIVCGVTIGEWAMIGAGAVVTRDVPPYGLVLGNPARLKGFVCPCGTRLPLPEQRPEAIEALLSCPTCQRQVVIEATSVALWMNSGE